MRSEYFQLLKEKFPTKSEVLTEIINLDAINHLPKGTEHFVSDLHGEYNGFDYILRNGSGSVRRHVIEALEARGYSDSQIIELCHLIYYPERKIEEMRLHQTREEVDASLIALFPDLLITVKYACRKYTRSKIRKMIPKSYTYLIEELLAESDQTTKDTYTQAIISKIHSLGQLEQLICVLCYLIQNLVVDHLHVVGDIYDRGPQPDKILDRLQTLRSVDIQWGNHDVTWMGAMSGSYICMVNIIRIAARYNNLSLIEESYGINLRPLIDYSRAYYRPLPAFEPILDEGEIGQADKDLLNIIQQSTAILQFKLEHQLIKRRPEFLMEHRLLLDKVDYARGQIVLEEEIYDLTDFNATCIDKDNVGRLSQEEEGILEQLLKSFQHSERLKQHIEFLFTKGSMYLVYNHQLLFHGCIPLHSNGDFKSLKIGGKSYVGRDLLDFYEEKIRCSYYYPSSHDDLATDLFWYLWVGESSSLFGKQAMTTFERYYIKDKQTHKEKKNAYYRLRNDDKVCISILEAFGLDEHSHIVNGHTPVIEKSGEDPIKAAGKLLVIDGGFSKGYQKKTGIAGYTLVYNSYGLELVAHRPFTTISDVLQGGCEIMFTKRLVEKAAGRLLVKDTNNGQKLSREIENLEHLYQYFEEY